MTTTKRVAYVLVLLGVLIQTFFDLGTLFLPSMASAEGVVVYPKLAVLLGGFMYRLAPYILFFCGLWVASTRNSRFAGAIGIASIVGTISPVIAIGVATAAALPGPVFRERFWPVRPMVQCLSFLSVFLAMVLWVRFTAWRHEAV